MPNLHDYEAEAITKWTKIVAAVKSAKDFVVKYRLAFSFAAGVVLGILLF